MSDQVPLLIACLRADLKRFERQMLLRWCVMLAVCFGALFAALHLWPRMADDPVQWDDPVMAAIASLDAKVDQMAKDTMGCMDRLQASLDATHENLSAIERMVRLYGR